MTVTVNQIKQFHESYNRLSLLDHIILLVVSEEKTVSFSEIYDQVFMKYRQVTKGQLKPLVRKLAKLDLIRFDYYIGGYIVTKTGIEELEFVKDYVMQKNREGVYTSSS